MTSIESQGHSFIGKMKGKLCLAHKLLSIRDLTLYNCYGHDHTPNPLSAFKVDVSTFPVSVETLMITFSRMPLTYLFGHCA